MADDSDQRRGGTPARPNPSLDTDEAERLAASFKPVWGIGTDPDIPAGGVPPAPAPKPADPMAEKSAAAAPEVAPQTPAELPSTAVDALAASFTASWENAGDSIAPAAIPATTQRLPQEAQAAPPSQNHTQDEPVTEQQSRVATVDVMEHKPGMCILTDPNIPLSKRSIYYEFDKFDVRDEYRPLIEAHGKYLRENPSAKMLIQGNTDERGSREYNVALGQRRSDGVKKMLLLLGAKENQIESVSLGEEKPKSEGANEQAWSQNRRSDMLYAPEF